MGDIVTLNCITRLDIPPSRVLEQALEANVADVVVLGYDKDGDFYFNSSNADGGDVLWLLENAKKRLLAMGDHD